MLQSVSLALLSIATVLSSNALAETVRLPVTQDNSIVMVEGEWRDNAGSSGRMRIKGNQHIVAMNFDVSAIRGKRVLRAELVCAAASEKINGVTISTIAAAWDELKSNGLWSGVGNESGWGYSGARFPAVCGGNSFTLVESITADPAEGVYRWPLPPDMLHALSNGIAFGLAIHEHDADYSRNPTIFSREQSGKQPYLQVTVADEADALPAPPSDLQLIPVDADQARLKLRAPPAGFAYRITVNGVPLGRHNIPLVQPGQTQTIPLRDLPEEVLQSPIHEVVVVTVNRTGQVAQASSVSGKLFQAAPVALADLKVLESQPARGQAARDQSASAGTGLAVIPVVDKYDLHGMPVGDLPSDYRSSNRLYQSGSVMLTAAAGEVASFQLLLRGEGNVRVSVSLADVAWRTDLFQALYVPVAERLIPDPLLPLADDLSLAPEQDAAVFADVYIPFEARPGTYRGSVAISDGRELPIALRVLPVAIPRRATFQCEMNSYGLPDHVADYYALQQVAYDHRVHANILHYSHHTAAAGARKSNLDMLLRTGRRMDNKRYDAIEPGATQAYWDDFVEAFGPFLDGSYFRDGHRGPIPAPGFYLTFHESWPLNCRPHFNGDPDAYRAFADSPLYAQTYTNILADFAELAKRQGWTETGFQVYFNNKGSLQEPTKAPWILDEPASFWDYRALGFYGALTDKGLAQSAGNVDYRIDISRPEYCRGELAGRSDLWVVSSSAFQNYRRLVTDRMERDALRVWVYGTSNPVEQSNRQAIAWALDAWREGASGLVPWQTVDKTGRALREADQLGLFIFDKDDSGQTLIRHSARLKAFREAEQLIERLVLVRERQGWTQRQMAEFIDRYVTLAGAVRQRDEADAGTGEYASRELLGLDRLWLASEALLR